MKTFEIAPYFTRAYNFLNVLASQGSLYEAEAEAVKIAFEQDFLSLDDAIELGCRTDRLAAIFAAGLENSTSFQTELSKLTAPTWKDYAIPPASLDLQDSLVAKLYHQKKPLPHEKTVLRLGELARYVGCKLFENALRDGIDIDIKFDGAPNFERLILKHCTDENMPALAQWNNNKYEDATKRLTCVCLNHNEDLITIDPGKDLLYTKLTKPISDRVSNGTLDYNLTCIPTEKDALLDNIPYDEYIKLFFELCDQPWLHIGKAQEYLIAKLDKCHTMRLTSGDGTDISMEFVDEQGKHFTFCNSLIARNNPGSEVFSAPRRDSVNGVIVAKGLFEYEAGKTIRDLTLHFEKGKLVKFEAAEGAEYFQRFLDRDPNNYYIGEFGKGTNPHLRRHVLNMLLVEKIGPSFHVALGKAYTYTRYGNQTVHVDNGNDSKDHWDITAMLTNKGTMELDGELIMKDGLFLDPELAVLNDGWAAVPVAERPDYWKNFQGYRHNSAFQPGQATLPVYAPT